MNFSLFLGSLTVFSGFALARTLQYFPKPIHRPFTSYRPQHLLDPSFLAKIRRSCHEADTLILMVDFDQVSQARLFQIGNALVRSPHTFALSCGNSEKRYFSTGMRGLRFCDNHLFLKSMRTKDSSDALMIMSMMILADAWKDSVQTDQNHNVLEFVIISNDGIFQQVSHSLRKCGLNVFLDSDYNFH